jgi:hypothetical protein
MIGTLLRVLPTAVIVLAYFAPRASVVAAGPAIQNIVPNTNSPSLYGVYEVGFELAGRDYGETGRFDAAVVDVRATFRLPNGATETVPGFYKQNTSPRWAVRYAPRVPGSYSYTLVVTDASGTSQVAGRPFSTSQPSAAGFVGVAGQRLRTSDGAGLVINGANAAWSEARPDGHWDVDYANQFAQFAANNLNFARFWASVHWDAHAIEYANTGWDRGQTQAFGGLGNYSLPNADRTDAIVTNAQARGIYLQWVLASFGDFEYNWADNAYNTANGGPCARPLCFETDPNAQAAWKRYLRYTFARWGAYSSLGIVEYWNEGDKESVNSNGPAWVQQMDAYWKSLDIYARPTTTSFAWQDHFDEQGDKWPTWNALPSLSVANQHRYTRSSDAVELWLSELAHIGSVGGIKPAYFGEYGLCACEDSSGDDPNGYYHQDGAWVPFFFGQAAGANLTWRVDGSFAPHGISANGPRAFGAFLRDEPRTLPGLVYAPSSTLTGNIRMAGYQGSNRALMLVRDWDARWDMGNPSTRNGVRATLSGLAAGSYVVQFWDTLQGTFAQTTVTVSGGSLTLDLPPFQRSIAMKLKPGTDSLGTQLTPTPTASATPTPTASATPASTASATPTPAASSTPTRTVTPRPDTPTPTPQAAGTGLIYDGVLRGGWQNESWGGTFDFASSAPAGTDKSIAVTYAIPEGVLVLHRTENEAVGDARTLRLLVHGGSAGGQRLSLRLADMWGNSGPGTDVGRYLPGGVLPAGQWTTLTIPLADLGFGSSGAGINRIELRNAAGADQPTFYVTAAKLE